MAANSAFYLKYRPQTLDDLIGQELIKETLLKAFNSSRISHAYLFCGPKGTGKTSTARILAKMVNCEKVGESPFPCNTCASCIAITDGSFLDLIEIDAASNRGIDDIRSLREGIKLSPTSARKKVYIIDEVHMLTTEAFNALLKTLEEPPAHVLFILATTEIHKIPATILSRVQKLEFQLASKESLTQALNKIILAEKIEMEEKALEHLVACSDGSFRDCIKLLDQLASRGENITLQMVEGAMQSGSSEVNLVLLQTIAEKNSQKALTLIEEQVLKGVNIKEFVSQLLTNLKTLLFIKNGITGGNKESEQLKLIAEKFELRQIISLINSLHTALEQLKYASIASLPLEVAILENTLPKDIITQKTVIQEVVATNFAPAPVQNVEEVLSPVIPVAPSEELNRILDRWQFVLETVKPYNYSLEALLRQVKVSSCEEGNVVFEVPYSFHQRIVEAPKSRDLLESVLSDVLGKPAKVSCILGARPVRVEEIANVELAADDEIIKVAAEIFNS